MHTPRHIRKNSGFSTQDEHMVLLGLEALTETLYLRYATCSKSECMRFIHSCCSLVVFFSRNALDSGCDLGLLIELGQPVQPWSVFV